MRRILHKISEHATKSPDAVAIRSGKTTIRYEELVAEIYRLADQLAQRHCQRLGLYLDNGIEWIVADLACAKAGITLVPLPWFFSSQQLQHAVSDAQLDGLILSSESITWSFPGTTSVEPLNLNLVLQHFSALRRANTKPHSIVKQSYTSGTTGQPKGIPLTGELIDSVAMSLSETTAPLKIESHLGLLPYSTLLENIGGIYVPLLQGKTVHAESAASLGLNSELKIDPMKWATLFQTLRPQSLIVTPQLLKLLCHLCESRAIDGRCLKFIAVGGARAGHELLSQSSKLGLPVFEGYGLTEAASVAFLNTPSNQKTGSVGKALPHVSAHVETDGELIIKFPNLDLPSVATGDKARIDDDGYVFIEGRKKNLIILSTGRNVSPEWIEGEINGKDRVVQSLVFGDDQHALSALIFAPTADDQQLASLVRRTNKGLPAYARIRQWHRLSKPFSTATKTMTSNGRLRRNQILTQLGEYLSAKPTAAQCTSPKQDH